MIEDADIHLYYVRAMAAEVNILSDFFPEKSDMIDNIITSTPHFATLERAPWDQLPFSQDDTPI